MALETKLCMAFCADPGTNIFMSCANVNEAVDFIRAHLEEPALWMYSEVKGGAICVTFTCLASVPKLASVELIEVHIDFFLLDLMVNTGAGAGAGAGVDAPPRAYVARFRACENRKTHHIQPLVQFVRRVAWQWRY